MLPVIRTTCGMLAIRAEWPNVGSMASLHIHLFICWTFLCPAVKTVVSLIFQLLLLQYRLPCYFKHIHTLKTYNTQQFKNIQHTTIVLWPFVWDYPDEPVPEETLTHPPSWSSSNLYQLLPSTTIHSILLVQITCLAIFLHNRFLCPFLSTSWSGALHLIFHTFLYPVSVFFLQHMPIPSQPVFFKNIQI